MFNVSIKIIFFMRNMTEVAIPWWNVNLKKLTIGLQLHMGAFDYTTNGVTMPVHSCMIAWSGQPADMS